MFGLSSIYVPPSDGRSRGVSVDLRRRNSIGSLDHRLSSPYAGGEGFVSKVHPLSSAGLGSRALIIASWALVRFPLGLAQLGEAAELELDEERTMNIWVDMAKLRKGGNGVLTKSNRIGTVRKHKFCEAITEKSYCKRICWRRNGAETTETAAPKRQRPKGIKEASIIFCRRFIAIADHRQHRRVPNAMQSSVSSNEMVYGGNSTVGSDESHVMSEKVQIIASSIYREFETMIQKHGQESIKELMAHVVNVLESLDVAYLEKEELVVDLEMLKEENEQLLNQYERERQMRKNQDQKCLEMEESLLEQNRELESKVESMASIVRMLELRAKNANDHAMRLEEREADQKIEYEKLHERYNELLRTHIEHVERTKFLMGAEMFDMAQSLPIGTKNNRNMMAMSAIDTNVRGISDLISAHMSQSTHADLNLANHISNERDWHEEFGVEQTAAEILATPRAESEKEKSARIDAAAVEEERARPNTEPGEQSDVVEEGDGISLGADLTGQLVDPAEFASAVNDTFIGMGKEVENLIRENTELLETKNALNIVKNDLIAQVDQLSSEKEVFREDVRSLEMVKLKMSERIREFESELKELREKMNNSDAPVEETEDRSQGKRFTRVEMARMVMEKNQYKEKFLELQETVKFTELKRAKKHEEELAQRRSKSIWSFFSNLLGDGTSANESSGEGGRSQRNAHREGTRKSQLSSPTNSKKQRTYDIDMDLMNEKRKAERRQHYRTVSQYMKQEEFPNAYAGWSMTSNKATESASIPVPVNCRPLLEQMPSLKVWCAAPSALHGGLRDGEYIVGDPISSCDPDLLLRTKEPQLSNDSEKRRRRKDSALLEASSLLWVCGSDEQRSFVSILDANQPSNILAGFSIEDANVLCVASAAGIRERDSRLSDEGMSVDSELCITGEYLSELQIPSEVAEDVDALGSVEFIALQKNEDQEIPTYSLPDEKLSPKRKLSLSQSFETNREAKRSLSSLANLPLHVRDALKSYEGCGTGNGNVLLTLPTMWIGLQNYFIHVHSAVSNWSKCLRRLKMPDAVLSILHLNGRLFAALANGSIAVFHRNTRGEWSDTGYFVVKLGSVTSSVCHLCAVEGNVWAACRNCVMVLDPVTLKIKHIITAHPRKDSQVRQMICCGRGVWLSIRLDSCIRLFHSENFQHLQDVDVEPFISKMLGANQLDSHLRITSLSELNRRIWVGTGSGIIVSIPLKEKSKTATVLAELVDRGRTPGQVIRVHSSDDNDSVTCATTPFCDITNAQLSFHGHKDAVRFLLPLLAEGFSDLTQSVETKKALMVSGGDGYIDFRLGDEDEANEENNGSNAMTEQIRARDLAHLLIWETECPVRQLTGLTKDQ
uniref:Uncharacterized protein n=1 Tax=Globodera rostochiensis TaxID=31243 RepID=A0A914HCM0_GLORO